MSRRPMLHAVLAAAGLLGLSIAGESVAQEAFSIDVQALTDNDCFDHKDCVVGDAKVSVSDSTGTSKLALKENNHAFGFGVSGGPSGGEIDFANDETLSVVLDKPRGIVAIKILFLYNGPEYSDRAEQAQVTADGVPYVLSTSSVADNAAVWSGPGSVSNCGGSNNTTLTGTGCFMITDPFPEPVEQIDFTAIHGNEPFPGPGGNGSNDSDYSIGLIDISAVSVVKLEDCVGAPEEGCPVASKDGQVGFTLNSVQSSNQGGSTDAIVIPVQLVDCRYDPNACLASPATSENSAREMLIASGVIKPLDPSGPNRLNPAVQLLNVTPLLPADVTLLFNNSGTPPGGLPPIYIGSRWRGQSINDYRFNGYFFKTDSGLKFSDVFEGRIDVSVLTGDELGCDPVLGHLLDWDVITTGSELAKSVGGRYIDMMINVGCINPTKVAGTRLSLYSINLEMVPTTYGPTIKSFSPKVTVNNDAVFARLVQSLWRDLGEVRASYACKPADPVPAGGAAPLSKATCNKLAALWTVANVKVDLCVLSTFGPSNAYQKWICGLAKQSVTAFKSALPGTATGLDPYNRLGELAARTDVFQHVWDTRFLESIKLKPAGFCREKGTCPP